MLLCVLTLIISVGHLQVGVNSNPVLVHKLEYEYTSGIGHHKVHTQAKTWNEAQSICETEGGSLAVINSEKELKVIAKLVESSLPHIGSYDSNHLLIGVHDPDWEGAGIPSEAQLHHPEPTAELSNDTNIQQNCGSITKDKKLNVISCDNRYAFVCEKPEYDGVFEVELWDPVEVNIVNRVVRFVGTEVTIGCDVHGYPTPSVRWYKDGSIIQPTDRINITGSKTLTISKINKRDAGKYRCEASNKILEESLAVDIVVIERMRVDIAVSPGPFLKGSEISLVCNVDEDPTSSILWFKGDDIVQTDGKMKILNKNKLIIPNADESDTGKYRCEASNEYTTAVHTVDIHVASPIEVRIELNEGPFVAGNELSMSCNVVGYPTPRVRWYKNGSPIQTNDRIVISEANTLTISATNENDSGRYRCEATNNYSSSVHTTDITVSAPLRVKVEVEKSRVYRKTEFYMACNFDECSGSSPSWYKDDNPIQPDDRIRISGNKLIVSGAIISDTGKYRCAVATRYSNGTDTVDIEVIDPVRVSIALRKEQFFPGSEIYMPCVARGYPTPTLRWFKDNTSIETSDRIKIAADDLIITAAEIRDTGKYRCEATNGYTSASDIVDIKVLVPITPKIAVGNDPFNIGSEIHLPCMTYGHPNTTLKWYKNGIVIQLGGRINTSGNKLIIFGAHRNDAGNYRCEVTDAGMSGAATVELKVIENLQARWLSYKLTSGIGYHKVYMLPSTWDEARLMCQRFGGDLAVIDSEQESKIVGSAVKAALPHFGSSDSHYGLIGFNDRNIEGRYITIENKLLSESGFNKWEPGEPNNRDGVENCGSISYDGKFNDISCNLSYAFVCEQSEYQLSFA